MNLRTVTRGDAALAFAALLLLIASFLPFFTLDSSICAQAGVNCSTNAWSSANFPLLPSVFLLGIIGALLVVLSHLRPGAAPRPAGIELGHWGTVLTVAAFWSALWSLFGGSTDVSIGAGAYLGFLGTLIAAGAAVAGAQVPALSAPLLPAAPQQQGGYPQGQPGALYHGQPVQQAQPGQPFHGPQQGGYGYPNPLSQTMQQPEAQQPSPFGYGYPQQGVQQEQSGQPFGTPAATPAPAPAPQDAAPPQVDRATAMLKPVQPEPEPAAAPEAEAAPEPTPAAAAAPEPAPSFAPFWFAVPAVRTLTPEQGGGAAVGELVPGTWYLAIAQAGDALLTQTQEGKRGLLTDTSGIQRG